MAMINCAECGASVSDQALVCPRCGRDVRVLKERGAWCKNCDHYWSCDHEYGAPGYVCLKWELDDSD